MLLLFLHRSKTCAGRTKISLTLNSTDPEFLSKANPTLAIIHFKDLEQNMAGTFEEDFPERLDLSYVCMYVCLYVKTSKRVF
jgi:hypothetical protein